MWNEWEDKLRVVGVSGDNEIRLLFAKMEVLHGDWLQTAWDMI